MMGRRFGHLRGLVSLGLILAAGTITTLLVSPALYSDPNALLELIRAYGATSVFVFILLGLLRPLTLIPSGIYGAVAGALFGTLLGTVAAVVGQMGGAIVAFSLARRFGHDGARMLLGDRLDRLNTQASFTAVLLGRLLPVVPGDLVSFSAGLSGMGLGVFLVSSLIGMVIPVSIVAFLGDTAAKRQHLPVWAIVSLLALVIGPAIYWRRIQTNREVGESVDATP